jgi:hypothetical protein
VATVGAASLSLIVPVAEAVPETIVNLIWFCNHVWWARFRSSTAGTLLFAKW